MLSRPGFESSPESRTSMEEDNNKAPPPWAQIAGGGASSLQVHALRLGPGQEMLSSLRAFVAERRLRAPFVIMCVGSVTSATLRLADATAADCSQVLHLSGRFEIVSLVGTLNPEPHLHISLADSHGAVVGGHLLGDLNIFTTAELLLGEAEQLLFSRELDPRTGFPELVVEGRLQSGPGAGDQICEETGN